MADVIAEYQRWKQQGGDLKSRARAAMEARFRELLTEAAQLADEYQTDFGSALKPPAVVTSFRYKRAKGAGAVKPKPKAAAPAEPVPVKADPKVAALRKRIDTARKKLEAAKAAGSATRDIEDRIYELEDALRLAQSAD